MKMIWNACLFLATAALSLVVYSACAVALAWGIGEVWGFIWEWAGSQPWMYDEDGTENGVMIVLLFGLLLFATVAAVITALDFIGIHFPQDKEDNAYTPLPDEESDRQ